MSPRLRAVALTFAALLLGSDSALASDPAARGLAVRTRSDATVQARIQRLKRAAQRAAAFNPEDSASTNGVTLSVGTTLDATLTKRYIGATLGNYVRVTGGAATYSSAGAAWYFPVASIYPATNANLSGALTMTPDYQAWGWAVEFQTDTATRVQVRFGSGSTNKAIRVVIDGRYIGKTPLAMVQAGANNYLIDFGGVAAPHTIRIEAQAQVALGSIDVAPTASIARTADADEIVALATGDSYSEGQGETYPGLTAWPKTLGRLMGWSDVRQVAVGGTGYLNAGSGRSTIRNQIPRWFAVDGDLSGARVDIVTVAAGYNDYTYAPAAVQAEALADFQAIRAACPNALIVVLGSSAGARGPDAATLAIEAAIKAAFATWGDGNALFVPVSADPSPWIFGTGRVGATSASGNSDTLVSTDGIHPSDAGHAVYARRAAAVIRGWLAAR